MISPSKFGAIDAYIWLHNKDGIYTTKSGYLVASKLKSTLDNGPGPLLELEWKKKVWYSPCLPKIKLFMWKLFQGALPLAANLKTRGCSNSVIFPRYGGQETAQHIILGCNFAKEV